MLTALLATLTEAADPKPPVVEDQEKPFVYGKYGGPMEKTIESTRKFVRRLDRLEVVANDLLMQFDREPERQVFSNDLRDFNAEVKALYGDFATGREALYELAKVAGVTTKRFSKPSSSKPATGFSDTDLLADLHRLAKDLGRSVANAGEAGSFFLRKGDEILKRLQNNKRVVTVAKADEEVSALVAAYLDFRDQVSASLYAIVGGFVKRFNELSARSFRRSFAESAVLDEAGPALLVLPWEDDAELNGIAEASSRRKLGPTTIDSRSGGSVSVSASADDDDLWTLWVEGEFKVAKPSDLSGLRRSFIMFLDSLESQVENGRGPV